MDGERNWCTPVYLFCLGLLMRFAAIPASLTRINTYSKADAVHFADTASILASRFLAGEFVLQTARSQTYERWGLILSPFWMLPGPSELYAHIFVAVLGAAVVYNVAVIAQHLHSRETAVIATLPLIFFPSAVAVQTALLREAAVLFGITTATRLLIARPPRLSTGGVLALSGGAIMFATILRPDNAPLYLLAFVVATAVYLIPDDQGILEFLHRPTIITVPLAGLTGFVSTYPYITSLVEFFSQIRSNRARGRTVYHSGIEFQQIYEVFIYSWIGALYFLFTPFPWMISSTLDIPVMIESLVSLVFAVFAVYGARILWQRRRSIVAGIGIGFLVGVILYGFGTVNAGTAVRHRLMFTWVLFLFGGVGIGSRIQLVN